MIKHEMDERFHPAEEALAAGDLERLDALLSADAELATACSDRSHPTLLQCLILTMPAADSLESLIDLLAKHGAELTDPLIAACGCGNVRAVRRLLDLGGRIEGNGRWSPLEEAAYFGQREVLDLLLERDAPVTNVRSAAALGRLDFLKAYCDGTGSMPEAAGAVAWPFSQPIDDSVRLDRRQILSNALVYAAHWGALDAADLLIGFGADVNLIPAGFDYAGTPLHYAAFGGHREMVDRLLGYGADPTIRDTKVDSLPADWAEHSGYHELAQYLRSLAMARV